MAGVLNLRLTLNQLIFSTCLGVECICTTPSLEAFCSSSDPVSGEAHWLMPHYRFSHNIVLYTLGLLGVSVVVARAVYLGPKLLFRRTDGQYHIRIVRKQCCVLFVFINFIRKTESPSVVCIDFEQTGVVVMWCVACSYNAL